MEVVSDTKTPYAIATPAPTRFANAPEEGREPIGVVGFYKDMASREWCFVFILGPGTPINESPDGGMTYEIPSPNWVPSAEAISYV